jgi:hypothetical protein
MERLMIVKGEGRIRVEAEHRLVKRYRAEYDRLARRRGHVDALRSLVKSHKEPYNQLVRDVREARGASTGPPRPERPASEAA